MLLFTNAEEQSDNAITTKINQITQNIITNNVTKYNSTGKLMDNFK